MMRRRFLDLQIDIARRLTAIDRMVHQIKGQRDKLQEDYLKTESSITTIEHTIEVLDGVKLLLKSLSKVSQESIKRFVEPLVTEALDFVFAKDIAFKVEFTEKRNQVEVDFLFMNKDGRAIGDVVESFGGGVLDVVALILRIGIAEVLHIVGPVFFDEPTKFVDEEHNERVGSLLNALSRKFSRQVVLITHSQQLASYGDQIYTVTQDSGGISNVREGML